MDDETQSGSVPRFVLAIVPIALIAIVFLVMRSRRKSQDDRAFSRITSTIEESELPDRAKQILQLSVDEVRGTISSIREMASEMQAH